MSHCDAAETEHLRDAIERILPALEQFNRRHGSNHSTPQSSKWMTALEQPLPQGGAGLDQVVNELIETIIPYGASIGSPGFSSWITTAPTTAGIAAALAATVAGAQRYFIQPFNALENIALKWLAELLGISTDWQGIFTSGGSVANLIGLGAARQRAFERFDHDTARDGLVLNARWRIYASAEVHKVVHRAAGVLGLGRTAVTAIPVDANHRLDVDHLKGVLAADRTRGVMPIALIANAGTVNTGAVDPIDQMAELASAYDTWLHVDGAYGLFGVLDHRVAPLFQGLEHADSVAVDPHKWLAAPVGCGAIFVRDGALLHRAFTMEPAEYLEGAVNPNDVHSPFDDFGIPYHHLGVEASAPSRGVMVWAILREIGAQGLRDRVIRHNDFARHLAGLIEKDERLELLAQPTLSICCFRYHPLGMTENRLDRVNAEIANRLRADGTYVPSTTRIAGKLAIRPCFINPRTRLADIDGLAARVRTIGDALASQ